MTASRRVPRDALPLPRSEPKEIERVSFGVSRGIRQRFRKRDAHAADVDRCVASLNSLYLGRPGPRPSGADPRLSAGQSTLMAHIRQPVSLLGGPPPDLTPA